ncbi:MAG: tRNA (guanosine(46)-N7)-methyltransferase TrmB [Pseudomonadota bacterium]
MQESAHTAGAQHKPVRVHGRKRGHRLSIAARQALEGLLPILSAPLECAAKDPALLFSHHPSGVWLEIGFGDGGHLLWAARSRPHAGFIGCEPYVNGVANLLHRIALEGLGNIRIHAGDARILMGTLPARSIAGVFILFPDPWPRKRHHKRRFISNENLDALARVLRPGAELHFASDSPDYCQWTLAHIQAHPDFTEARHERGGAPLTKYEARAQAEGRSAQHLRFIRI